MKRASAALMLCLALVVLAVPGAQASFPGKEGLILFDEDGELFVIRADGTGLRQLTFDGGAYPSWSADGRMIVFRNQGSIHTMRADGGGIFDTGATGWDPAWSPDRTRIAYWDFAGVWTMRPDGTGRRLIFESTRSETFVHAFFTPSWSVDGYLATTEATFEDGVLVSSDILVESPPPVADCGFSPGMAVWSPDGRMLAVNGDVPQMCLTDGITGPTLFPFTAGDMAWSPQQDRLVLSTGQIVDLEGNVVGTLPFRALWVDWQPRCTATGTPGDDALTGTDGDDVICGLGGDDTLFGLGGADVIYGGSGDDYLEGGPGPDLIYGGFNADRLFGNGGPDFVSAGPGADIRCNGGSGIDRAEGCEVSARIP